MAGATTTPALKVLREMRDEVVKQKEDTGSCTLSYWRLTNPVIWKAMEDFASSPDWPYNGNNGACIEEACRKEVQALFTNMNRAMVEQERKCLFPGEKPLLPSANQWSVVFGGKWAVQPCSIAEELVDLLTTSANGEARVYTVSRTSAPQCTDSGNKDGPPCNVIHFAKQNLDNLKGGKEEFEQVLNRVVDDWEKVNMESTTTTTTTTTTNGGNPAGMPPIVFYFTLGKHKGDNLPFQRNIQSVDNFVQALESIVPTRLVAKGIPWKVVITGTDATNPSTQPDPILTVQGVLTTAPTYKMVTYNTVYAASKLCQFYKIATAVAKISGTSISPALESTREGNDGSLAVITQQIVDFVVDAGNNGVYRENVFLTDKELDAISNYWTQVVEPSLQQYLQTAKSISICYTPLHRDPWTAMCLSDKSKESPKKFMIQNIIWRLKNAISIDRAARAHF